MASASRRPLEDRIARLRRALSQEGLEGVVMAPGPNIRYYTGVESQLLERPFLLFVPRDGEVHLVAPRLEAGPYRRAPLAMEVHDWTDAEGPSSAFESLWSVAALEGRWGCEGRVPFGFFDHVRRRATTASFTTADSVLQSVREAKDGQELNLLRKAVKILVAAYSEVPGLVKAGMTEMELAHALREEIFAGGGEGVDFCMVQAGKNAADPHRASSSKRIRHGDGVIIDAGCTYGGYNADITRALCLGENREFERVYRVVLESNLRAIRAVRSGAEVGALDAAARGCLEEKGFGEYFIHRTGHGLGLEVHEAPYIVPGGKELLRPGMVFTIEPGVYIPGRTGVRIEDDIAVTRSGGEVLTGSLPKEYGWWR